MDLASIHSFNDVLTEKCTRLLNHRSEICCFIFQHSARPGEALNNFTDCPSVEIQEQEASINEDFVWMPSGSLRMLDLTHLSFAGHECSSLSYDLGAQRWPADW